MLRLYISIKIVYILCVKHNLAYSCKYEKLPDLNVYHM